MMHPTVPGLQPQQFPWKMARSGGLTNIGLGNQSLISDPKNLRTIVLDHVNKTARIIPSAPAPPQLPGEPVIPGVPGAPSLAGLAGGVDVKDLGKQMILGQEAEGKLFSVKPPAPPTLPGVPGMPSLPPRPAIPGLPTPAAFKPPTTPQAAMTTVEVWTSTQLHVPLLTKINGPGGQTISTATKAVPCNPPPSFFQIPPEYKVIP